MDGEEQQSGLRQPGMGPSASGPQFRPGPAAAPGSDPLVAEQAPVSVPSFAPPSSRLPAVVTAVVVATVGLVVLAATLVAREADERAVSQVAVTTGPTPVIEREDRIAFTSRTGTGELILERRSWKEVGDPAPVTGSYLTVEVAIECETGTVDYDPELFRAFDANGRLFSLSLDSADGTLLDIGTLGAGERVSGTLVFDIPRGAVTLLMTDDSDQTVTALRVPD